MPKFWRKTGPSFLASLLLIINLTACASPAIKSNSPESPPAESGGHSAVDLPSLDENATSPETSVDIPEVPEGIFYIAPEVHLGAISPLVYGVNHGPWAVITEKTLPFAQEAGIRIIRFPGGEWGDNNDLRPYHIDQFVSLANQMGSEISLTVRLLNGSPEKAAELVRYANIEKGYGIRYWSIGNEPSLYATGRGEPDYGVDRFNQDWRAFAQAMKAVDETIQLSGPEVHQFGSDINSTPKDPFGKDWMKAFLIANGDLVDVVTIHRYPFPAGSGGRAATIEELAASSIEWDAIIPFLRSMIIEITGRDIPIAVTEVNSHWSNAVGGEASPDSFYNAIWWADVLGRMIVNRVSMVNYFSLQSQVSTGGYGLFSRAEPRPTYYIYRLYQEFGEALVFAGCDDPQIGIYASIDAQGRLAVIIVNLGETSITKPLVIEGGGRDLTAIWKFDEAQLLSQIELDKFNFQGSLTLPAQTVLLLKFE